MTISIEGAFDAGASRVRGVEGHESIDILQMDERATLVPAHYPALPIYSG